MIQFGPTMLRDADDITTAATFRDIDEKAVARLIRQETKANYLAV